jgi:hypothetical protein
MERVMQLFHKKSKIKGIVDISKKRLEETQEKLLNAMYNYSKI